MKVIYRNPGFRQSVDSMLQGFEEDLRGGALNWQKSAETVASPPRLYVSKDVRRKKRLEPVGSSLESEFHNQRLAGTQVDVMVEAHGALGDDIAGGGSIPDDLGIARYFECGG